MEAMFYLYTKVPRIMACQANKSHMDSLIIEVVYVNIQWFLPCRKEPWNKNTEKTPKTTLR